MQMQLFLHILSWKAMVTNLKILLSCRYFPCTYEVQRAISVLKNAYIGSMKKVLYVGPKTCLVISRLFREDEIEAWGMEPYL